MSKCCIHVKLLYGQVIRSGDIGFNLILLAENYPVFYCSDLEN